MVGSGLTLMVGRCRERQYQLAAQRHNEAYLKQDYYQRIATYFERECRNARHYDSWNEKSIDPRGELKKAKKAERLLARRSRLRALLADEDESYRREIEERKRVKNRPEDSSSLESLREKLIERRAEQSLYYPRNCRRYRSYFVCPTRSASSTSSNDPSRQSLWDTNLRYSRACRDSTNLPERAGPAAYRRGSKISEDICNGRSSSSGGMQQQQQQQQQENSPTNQPASVDYHENARPGSKYSARYAHRSLENTNVRNEDSGDYPSHRNASRSSLLSMASPDDRYLSPSGGEVCGDSKENSSRVQSPPRDTLDDPSGNVSDCRDDASSQRNVTANAERSAAERSEEAATSRRDKENRDENKKDTRQFEVEKSMPWLRMIPGDKNLSKQMFLYLTHKELKCKIEDLTKREMHACNKQCWDEALRLRDMRNRLELIREKKLYSMDTLELDEESRKRGWVNIDKREAELAEREHVCMDSTMYSQDAKDLWKIWVREDERSVIKDARLQREVLMSSLEKEWQNLAIRDKERISRSYQSVMNDSALQEEHKLAGAINASRMKSVANS